MSSITLHFTKTPANLHLNQRYTKDISRTAATGHVIAYLISDLRDSIFSLCSSRLRCLVIVCHFQASPLEAALYVETFVRIGAVEDGLCSVRFLL